MAKEKAKILMLVEGAKTDVKLMTHLLEVYGIDNNHTIVSYNTNIYTLYNEMFADGDPDSKDLLQVLKAHETDDSLKPIFDESYSDILLIFDLDPQDGLYSAEKIIKMAEYFVESSDMGKLYINYPMVEAFYHMKSIPDPDYCSYTVTMQELTARSYKERVNRENRNHNYQKFAVDRSECSTVIKQNIEKSAMIAETADDTLYSDLIEVLRKQTQMLSEEERLYVLCTCAFYIVDYSPKLIGQE
jgi:hypothetical protein